MSETIEWKNATTDLPDEGLIVLIKTPSPGEPVWLGYLEDGNWYDVDGMGFSYNVTHWADLPKGPE